MICLNLFLQAAFVSLAIGEPSEQLVVFFEHFGEHFFEFFFSGRFFECGSFICDPFHDSQHSPPTQNLIPPTRPLLARLLGLDWLVDLEVDFRVFKPMHHPLIKRFALGHEKLVVA